MAKILKSVGIFGGTFDPIHTAHIKMAEQIRESLALQEMRLLPCRIPPHRQSPQCSADHRAAMAKEVVENLPGIIVDERELAREGPSYSFDTLVELRKELGENISLCLCMGLDSLLSLPQWHRWQELLNLAHIVVAARPQWQLPEVGVLADWLSEQGVLSSDAEFRASAEVLETIHGRTCGSVVLLNCELIPVSATEIRRKLQEGHSVVEEVPEAALNYIRTHKLYTGKNLD